MQSGVPIVDEVRQNITLTLTPMSSACATTCMVSAVVLLYTGGVIGMTSGHSAASSVHDSVV